MQNTKTELYIQPAEDLNEIPVKRTQMAPVPDYQTIKNNFVKDLKAASVGRPSTLSFLRHYIPRKPLVTSGLVQGIVIGGTHYTIAIEKILANGQREVIKKKRGRTPVLSDCKVLSAFLEEYIKKDADAISLSLAFPMLPTKGNLGEMDGIVEYGTKEHTLEGLTGKAIGTWIKKKFNLKIPVAVANDVICLTKLSKGHEEAGFIAATGINMGIIVQQKMAVNLEAGNFNSFESDPILEKIDSRSQNKGKNRFEKKAGGKYLPYQFNETVKKLGLTDVVPKILKTEEISFLAEKSEPSIARELARQSLEQSASLVATQIAGLYEFKGKPAKLGLIGEGSLLWKGYNYVNYLQARLENLDVPAGAITIRHIENSHIEGALALLTT